MMSDTKAKKLVRIPVELAERLARCAERNNRSENGEILTAIRDHLERQEKREER